jgi:hypothetical protein
MSDEDGSFLLSLGLGDLFLGVGSEFILLLVDLGSCDLHLKLIELPLVNPL